MDRLSTEQRQQFDDVGYTVVDNLLSADEVGVLRDALTELESSNRQDECLDWKGGHIVTIHHVGADGTAHTIEASRSKGVHIGTVDWSRVTSIKRPPSP